MKRSVKKRFEAILDIEDQEAVETKNSLLNWQTLADKYWQTLADKYKAKAKVENRPGMMKVEETTGHRTRYVSRATPVRGQR